MTRPFSTVWVIGLGTTGCAFAALVAQSGIRVVGVEKDNSALKRGRTLVRRRVNELVAALGLPTSEAGPILGRIDYTARLNWAPAADLVIESLPEQFDVKCTVLEQVNTLCDSRTVFVTTTTGLSVTEIASRSGRMTRTVGLHLCNAGQATTAGALEVVSTPVTDDSVTHDIGRLVLSMGKTPVQVTDRPGFIGGALTMGYLNRAAAMYEEGYASRDDIDVAMTLGCGLPMGPLQTMDTMGLDVVHDTLSALYRRSGDPAYAPTPILGNMVSAGLLGRKSTRGFYEYEVDDDAYLGKSGDDRALRPADPKPRPIRHIGLVGAGTMAAGIAEVCVRSGSPATLVARTDIRAKEARATVERSLHRSVRRGRLTSDDLDVAMERLTTTSELAGLNECDLVIEAVVEDIEVKRGVFAELDKLARPGAILATTTSSLPVLECALATSRPQNVLGLHFFNPAPAMRLLEVVRTVLTSDEVVGIAHALGAALGKRTVSCTDRAGFIVNFLLFPYLNKAVEMLHKRYVSTDDVDKVMTQECGYPLGPFQLLDLVGLDVSLAIQSRLQDTFHDSALAPAQCLENLVESGYLGRKNSRGFRLS